jgi:hypothetical protein
MDLWFSRGLTSSSFRVWASLRPDQQPLEAARSRWLPPCLSLEEVSRTVEDPFAALSEMLSDYNVGLVIDAQRDEIAAAQLATVERPPRKPAWRPARAGPAVRSVARVLRSSCQRSTS